MTNQERPINTVQFIAHNHRVYPESFDNEPQEPLTFRPRGRVGGFSKYSKQRLSALVYSFKEMPFKSFWTLTFEKDVSTEFAKKELHRLLTIFSQHSAQNLWIMEFTKKGRSIFTSG